MKKYILTESQINYIISEIAGGKNNYTINDVTNIISKYDNYSDFVKNKDYNSVKRFLQKKYGDKWKDVFYDLTSDLRGYWAIVKIKDYIKKFNSKKDLISNENYKMIKKSLQLKYGNQWKEVLDELTIDLYGELRGNWTLEKVISHIKQFKTMSDFKSDKYYGTINNFIYSKYGEGKWKELTSNLTKKVARLRDNDEVTKELIKQFPQWDFSNISYYWREDGRRFLNGLECHIKDENGIGHGISNDISVNDLKLRGNGCRKCGTNRVLKGVKVDIKKWIEDFPKDRGLIFNPKNFFYKENNLAQKTLFVKDVICIKHDPPVKFAEDGVNVHNLRKGKTGCPICGDKESNGEIRINYYLEQMGYDIKKQKTFNGCYSYNGEKFCNLLKFDAYVVKKDGQEVCIEYDGIQHYEPVKLFGGEEALNSLKIRDKIKTDYCKSNNITLIRIPYWDYNNIKEILLNKLGYYNK
jgi:hypothetical protein